MVNHPHLPQHPLPGLPPFAPPSGQDTLPGHGLAPATDIYAGFQHQARSTPDAAALDCAGTVLSYAELERRASLLAQRLRHAGVGAETIVGVCLERGPWLPIALLAILKAGGVYFPLDPGYPPARLRMMLDDARPALVLSERGVLARHGGAGWLDLDQAAAAPLPPPASVLEPAAGAGAGERLAYLVYTSGSTGHPKGVAGTMRALASRLAWMQQCYPCRPGERCAQKTSIGFIDSLTEVLTPLLAGGTLAILAPRQTADTDALWTALQDERIERLVLVPSLLRALLEHAPVPPRHHLKLIISSGEALAPPLAAQALRCLPGVTLLNLYGSSEVAGDVSLHQCQAGAGSVPLGHAAANTALYILDEQLQPVPPGEPGELYVAGAHLARGYLNRPGLTAERFIAAPFPVPFGPGARLYRTGDIARRLPDGSLAFCGRQDSQVKVNGVRIELGEIEAVLAALPGVRQAQVLAHADVHGGVRLAAYAVAGGSDAALLRTQLAARLPGHMVPAHVTILECMPLLPNGKVDRLALPAPAAAGVPYAAPRNDDEAWLAEQWAAALGLERVGIDDDFFALGGHSLLAMQLLGKLRQRGLSATLHMLFEAPTVARLAAALQTAASAPPSLLQWD